MSSRRRVVVTGMGVVTSVSESLDALWQAIIAGQSGIKAITRFDLSEYTTTIGGECTDFTLADYLEAGEAKVMDRQLDRFAQFALAASMNAVKDAQLDLDTIDRDRAGVVIGTGIGGIKELEESHKVLIDRGPNRVSPRTVPRLMANAGAGNVSIHFGLTGPCTTVATACATGGNAIGDATRLIQWNEADIVIAGGAEAALTPLGLCAFTSARALSRRNDDPTRASRPWDKDRDGFVMGEGAGIMVLESLEHAQARGARIYAEVLGYGMSADAFHITNPDLDGTGAQKAMKKAIADAGLSTTDLGYINAHGTSTLAGDRAEVKAVKAVLGEHAYNLPISSTKSHLGHLLGASGGVEGVITALSLYHQKVPPTINLETPDEGCDLDFVPGNARDHTFNAGMSNSFGFGGHNVSLILGKAP